MTRRQPESVSDADYARLLQFRDGLRRFQHWSEEQAKDVGLSHAQHQLLLAVRGHDGPPSMSDVATHLAIRHNSVVELVDRAERAGLVKRIGDESDQRVVRLRLTADAEAKLARLTAAHLEELSRLRPRLDLLWKHLP